MTDRAIEPVPTRYHGVLYRSRTEARWAVFFDALGVDATYEPESYSIDGVWYLPDFFVLSWNLFAEIKGEIPTPFERDRCRKLAALTGKNVLLFAGAPGERHGEIFFPARGNDPSLHGCAAFAQCRRCPGYLIEYWGEYETSEYWGAILLGDHKDPDRCGEKLGGDRFAAAAKAARSERFGVHPDGGAA